MSSIESRNEVLETLHTMGGWELAAGDVVRDTAEYKRVELFLRLATDISQTALDRIHERNRELDAKVQKYELLFIKLGVNPNGDKPTA